MTRETVDELRAAWRRWDRRPTWDVTARAMEAACQRAAREVGVTATVLRVRLSGARRAGCSIDEAVVLVAADLASERRAS